MSWPDARRLRWTPTLYVPTDDGTRIAVEILGDGHPGPTLVFVHGWTFSSRSYHYQRMLAERHRLVFMDHRGHGESDPGPRENRTVDQIGRDLQAVVEATCADRDVILVGHSMGGMTVMAFAQQFPEVVRERVVAVAFLATSAGGSGMIRLGFGQMVGRILGRLGPRVLQRLGHNEEWVRGLRRFGRDVEDLIVDHYSFASPVSRACVRYTGDMIFGTPFQVMADFLPSIDVHDKREALAQFRGVETLVLNGMQDLLTPPDHSEDIVRLVPGAEHVVVADAGHIIMLEHPELVTEQLLGLIERGTRAAARGIEVERKPRVRRTVTDLGKRRRVASARRRGRHAS